MTVDVCIWQSPCNNSFAFSLNLAFKDSDSTIVYYRLSEGLEIPDPPEAAQHNKTIDEKKKLMQSELWRKRNQLYQSAKDNTSSGSLDPSFDIK